jgi:hypothetical protein
MWLAEPVTVGPVPVTGVHATLQPGMTVSGRIDFDGAAALPTEGQVANTLPYLEPLSGKTAGAEAPGIVDGSAFRTAPYPPGRYRFLIPMPSAAWTVASITWRGRDLLDEALELTTQDVSDVVVRFTDRETVLAGGVRRDLADDDEVVVILFPAAVEEWVREGMFQRRAHLVTASDSGAFTLRNLRPGEYFVVGLGADHPVALENPDFVRAAARLGTRVVVKEGHNTAPVIPVSKVR